MNIKALGLEYNRVSTTQDHVPAKHYTRIYMDMYKYKASVT